MITEYFAKCMTVDELEKEHRRLVLQMHPDRNSDNPNATAEFQEMQAQYEERLAELNGDYTKAAKGRARREQAEREQKERERKERERDRLAEVLAEARKNKTVDYHKFKVGDYIYARKLKFNRSMFDWDTLSFDDIMQLIIKSGVEDETVVKIEHIYDLDMADFTTGGFYSNIMYGDIFGGWETVQNADPSQGIYRQKKVAKVVMFRTSCFYILGNPNGDMAAITDYYVPINYETMFSDQLYMAQAELEREAREKAHEKELHYAEMLRKQQPLIDEWSDKLVAISAALSDKEKETVALTNLKTMLKAKFPGVKFSFPKSDDYYYHIRWQDGPTESEIERIRTLFYPLIWDVHDKEQTPWEQRFGHLDIGGQLRSMTTITKAKIIQQLSLVNAEFATKGLEDTVELTQFEYNTLNIMVGVSPDLDRDPLHNLRNKDGKFMVRVDDAINFVFYYTSYVKPKAKKKTSKKKATKAA